MAVEPLIRYEDVAERLGLSRSAVVALVNRRAIPVVKINRRCHRFKWSEVEAAVARLTVKPR